MKHIFALLVIAVAALSLTACNESSAGSSTKKKIKTNLSLNQGTFQPSPTPSPTASPSPSPSPTPTPAPPAPVIGALPPYFKTNTFNVAGTGTVGSVVELLLGGTSVGTNAVNGSSDWLVPVGPLTDGVKVFTAVASFPGGDVSSNSAAVTTTVDTAAPNAPVFTGPTLVCTNGLPTLEGTAEADCSVAIFVGGTNSVGTTNATGLGNWLYTLTTALTNGVYSFTATATDAAGNTSTNSAAWDVTVDTNAPAAPVITGPAGGISAVASPSISGTAEAGAVVRLFVDGTEDGTTLADGAGAWDLVPGTALAEGTYVLTAQAVDGGGLVSPMSADFSLTINFAAPDAPLIAEPTGTVTTTRTPTASGTAVALGTVSIFVDGVLSGTTAADGTGNWAYTFPADLADGTYTLTAQVTTTGGDTSPLSDPFTLTINVP